MPDILMYAARPWSNICVALAAATFNSVSGCTVYLACQRDCGGEGKTVLMNGVILYTECTEQLDVKCWRLSVHVTCSHVHLSSQIGLPLSLYVSLVKMIVYCVS